MSSKRRLRRNGCGTKIKHASQRAAWAQISSLSRSIGAQAQAFRPYQCKYCSAWHIGHQHKTFFQ